MGDGGSGEEPGWAPYGGGESVGDTGSEGGIIIRDEVHRGGARITLERDGRIAPFSITCGIYGWMVHTAFFGSLNEADERFGRM
jgi:hypothetical protein